MLLYVFVLDTIYGLVTKKIAVGNLRKIIVTPKEDNLFLYIVIYGVTIIFLKFSSYHDQFNTSDWVITEYIVNLL